MGEYKFQFPCSCCGGGAFEWQCRSRDGTATLCGFDEYVPTVPPRKYLKRNLGGRLDFKLRPTTCAADPYVTASVEMSGACEYTFPGCALQVNGTQVLTVNGVVTTTNGLCAHSTAECAEEVKSATQRLIVAKACGGGDPIACTAEGSLSETLASEDTEEDAMARVSSEWTAWGAGSCCTYKQPRIAGGFTFAFTEAEYRIRVKGGAGELINLVLTFSRSDGPDYEEMRQFVAQGAEFGDWFVFPVQAAPGATTCLGGIRRYLG